MSANDLISKHPRRKINENVTFKTSVLFHTEVSVKFVTGNNRTGT